MPPNSPTPEILFQKHIADFLVREHRYTVLEQAEIDPETGWNENGLWSFLQATQGEALRKLEIEYGSDARDQVFRALADALRSHPLWWIIRHGLEVRGTRLNLYFPSPRSPAAAASSRHSENGFAVRPHFYVGTTREEVDLVLFLNGLPIVALELKHEAGSQGWNVHDAVAQFAARDHSHPVFRLPFLYLAADTTEVKMATDPRRPANFRWFNTGLRNEPLTQVPLGEPQREYAVEFLYREVLSPERLLEALEFLLVWVPERHATEDTPHRPAHTLYPRYHQQRMVRKVADAALENFIATGEAGGKYLIEHSAGSGKTLSICWLAERLHSLHQPLTGTKLADMAVILTDRKSLDKNIRDEIDKFAHLADVVGIAKSADELARFLRQNRSIIVTTQQKFGWIRDQIQSDPALRGRRVAYLIDEAHRSQEGRLALAIRLPFRDEPEGRVDPDPDADQPDDPDDESRADAQAEAEIAAAIRANDRNQLFVAFTATPSQATVDLFGAPFDRYTEAEAIQEGYIVDVAGSILSYETLFNLHCPLAKARPDDRTWPAGVVAKALRNVAFQDEELIQYKAEVMLRIFDERVKPMIGGRAKAMIVATSRIAGLRYYEILRDKLRERKADYQVLYAFSDFTHPESNAEIRENTVNGLENGEPIEDRFEGDSYRLMVVANKFQTGFDQPLLAGMFLDKVVVDRNAVQTVSRLNRQYEGKHDVIVVDFTNNAKSILQAFQRYRQGTPFEPGEPTPAALNALYDQIIACGVFEQRDAFAVVELLETGDDAARQGMVAALKTRFEEVLGAGQARRDFVNVLARYVKCYYFLANFFSFTDSLRVFARFAEFVGPQLIKKGAISELMQQIRATGVVRASVKDHGETRAGPKPPRPPKPRPPGPRQPGPTMRQVTVGEMIERLREKYPISDEEALLIREVMDEKSMDESVRQDVRVNLDNQIFLAGPYKMQMNAGIQAAYSDRGRYEDLADPKYSASGGIFDMMAITVIDVVAKECRAGWSGAFQ